VSFESPVRLVDCKITTGAAGAGGEGGAGGAFINGGMRSGATGGGCRGGNGGHGGKGGAGGGGAGGLSAGVVYRGAKPNVAATIITKGTKGAKGVGGNPTQNDGVEGDAVDTREFQ